MNMLNQGEKLSSGEKIVQSSEYWKSLGLGDVDRGAVPHDFFSEGKYEKRIATFSVDGALLAKLGALTHHHDLPLFVVFAAGLVVQLSRYSNQEAYILGIPAYVGRLKEDHPIKNKILPLKTVFSGEGTVKQLLKAVQESVLKAYDNQYCDVEHVLRSANTCRNVMELTSVNIALNTLHTPEHIECLSQSAHNRLAICLDKQGTRSLDVSLVYNARLFKEEAMELFGARYLRIVRELVADLERSVRDIEMIEEEEKRQILHTFNDTFADYPREATVKELFEAQADQTPDRLAVVCRTRSLTYKALNEKANQLARLLSRKGVRPDTLVAVMTHGSLELIVAMLAVLKAGGAYVPIDVSYPDERKQYMLRDAGVDIVLSTPELMGGLAFEGTFLDLTDDSLFAGDASNPETAASSRNLAYVIYTSGSTGNPKGVMIEHRSLINYISFCRAYYQQNGIGDFPLFTSISFDLTVTSIYVPLLSGKKITVYDTSDKLSFLDIVEQPLDIMKLTPAHLSVINGLPIHDIAISKFIVGGEELSYPLTDSIYRKFQGKVDLINEYGPTEATVGCIVYKYEPKEQWEKTLPIGKPIHNTRVYILDQERSLAPIGVVGELWIAGDGLARGYWNRPELTAEKFAEDPFHAGERMYRTGDLARWLPDGNIEFFGRTDNQVKIRGFRIELGEIEARLLGHPEVREAVVLARENERNEKYLAAYFVGTAKADISDIKSYLKDNLPEYMVPPYFTQLKQLPLTGNGKIDRKALPEPGMGGRAGVYEAPRNEAEARLADVWAEVLGVERVGIRDNFFDLGGDSIKAIRIASKLQRYGYRLEVQELFNHGTIHEVSGKITAKKSGIRQEAVTGEAALTPIQAMFFERGITDRHHWNQSVMLYSKDGFREDVVREVFKHIVIHHDALRMVYPTGNGRIRQVNRAADGRLFDFMVADYRQEADAEELIREQGYRLQSSIDLEHGPLVKLGLFRTNEGDHLLIAIHHLVIDGVSWRILLEDFVLGCKQALNGERIGFQEKTDSFQAWGAYLRRLTESERLQEEAAYWERIEQADVKPLPADRPWNEADGKHKPASQRKVRIEFSRDDTEDLVKRTNRAYNTDIQTVLLTALTLAVQEWTAEERVLVNLEGHGRETPEGELDISRTVGWFTTHYPVLLEADRGSSLAYSIKRVKETLKQIPHKGIGYGILKHLGEPKPWKARPQISFNYLGQFDEELRSGMFELSKLSGGPSVSPNAEPLYEIDIVGDISDDRLALTIAYNSGSHHETTITNLADSFKRHLLAVIRHCMSQPHGERTPSDYMAGDLELEELDALKTKYESGMQLQINEIYPLTPMQEGMLFHSLMDGESSAYFEQRAFTVEGLPDIALFEESFRRLVQRYDILKAAVVHESLRTPKQIILEGRQARFRYKDLSAWPEGKCADYVAAFETADRTAGFRLSEDPLIRLTVFRLSGTRCRIVWSWHHILMDGWCGGIVMNDFFTIYYSLLDQQEPALEAPVPYSRYIEWLQRQSKSKAARYWERYVEGYETVAQIPGNAAPEGKAYKKGQLVFTLNQAWTEALTTIGKKAQVTMNTVIQAVWGVLLQKYVHAEDVVFGTVVSGRNADVDRLDEMVGLFINTIPVRVRTDKSTRFVDLLQRMQQEALESGKYDYFPLADIQALSKVKRKLVNHIVTFQNYYVDDAMIRWNTNPELKVTDATLYEQNNYDLDVTIVPGDELRILLAYNEHVYDAECAAGVQRHLEQVIGTVVANAEIPVSQIEMITPEEKRRILYDFNVTLADVPRVKTIHRLFEEQAERTPDHAAVVYRAERLTYRELNEQANRLARTLRAEGVRPDGLVGIMAERSLEMVVGILGILKAGGAYVPIDPDYPGERIRYMLDDSGAQLLVLSHRRLQERTGYAGNIVALDDAEAYDADGANLEPAAEPNHLAYVIYTSGTTGKPKGVMVEHRQVAALSEAWRREYRLEERVRLLQWASFSFDVFTGDLVRALLNGGELILCPGDARLDPAAIYGLMREHRVTIFESTPALVLPLMNDAFEHGWDMSFMRTLIVGSDQWPAGEFRQLNDRFGADMRIINSYGVTEACIDASYFEQTEGQAPREYRSLPIGKPLPGVKLYILSGTMAVQPIGVTGELYIGGRGVARGYLRRPELTAEKFVDNPFAPGERMYRTGDLARWLPDGTVEFLGRIDDQVKVRGFRIEPGEIEAKLLGHPAVKEAVVLAKEIRERETVLAAYLVGPDKAALTEIRSRLRESLPHYMVPSYFTLLERMPLTGNGKVDRRALPEPDLEGGAGEYEAPGTEAEARLAEVWREVLGVSRVGVGDNFFELGGDSIKAIRIVSKLQKHGYRLEIKELFQGGSVREISRRITQNENRIEQAAVTGEVGLTPIQTMFFEQGFTDPHHWNQAVMLYSRQGFQEGIVRQVFERIVIHHDALRMVYRKQNNRIVQVNRAAEGALFDLTVIDYRPGPDDPDTIQEQCALIQSSIDLEKGPLVKLGLFKAADGDHLLIAIHHLVVDGVSWRILLEDFALGCQQALNGDPIVFQSKTNSFQEWAAYLRKQAASERLQREFAYWDRLDKAELPVLPADRKDAEDSCKLKHVQSVSATFSKEETEHLLKDTNRAYRTEINDILLTALGLAIGEWTAGEQVLVNLEGHGREKLEGDIDITRTVGWFTTYYPVLLPVRKDRPLSYSIKSVKETLRQVPHKGIGYGILKYLGEARIWNKVRPRINFNYLGQFDEAFVNSIFEMSPLSAGPSVSPEGEQEFDIDISGIITNRRLEITIRYNSGKYNESTMEAVAALYKRSLLAIVEHCRSRPSVEPTPSDYSAGDLDLEELEALKASYEQERKFKIKDIYPLTPMQEGMLFHSLLDQDSGAYFEQTSFVSEGELDIALFEASFRRLFERYDILRTVIVHENLKSPKQMILEGRATDFHYEDLSGLGEEQRAWRIAAFEADDRKRGFTLSEDSLIRLSVLKLGRERYKVIWSSHHILMDGWCSGIVIRDFFAIYGSLRNGRKIALQEPARYRDYIRWLQQQPKNKARHYWQDYVAGYDTVARLPGNFKAKGGEFKRAKLTFTVERAMTEALAGIGKEAQVTMNTIIQAVWGILLQKYVNAEDVVFGSVVSGRNADVEGIEEMVGLFINTIPIRVRSDRNTRFIDLLKDMQNDSLESAPYDYYPLADIQSMSEVRQQLVNHIVIFQNYYVEDRVQGSHEPELGFTLNEVTVHEQTNYDLDVMVFPGDELKIMFSYNEQTYDRQSATKVMRHFQQIIGAVAGNCEVKVSQIDMTTEDEKRLLLDAFNATKMEYPQERTLQQLFEAQAEERPDRVAVAFGDRSFTYRELNEKSNQLARVLRGQGVGADTIVGLMVDRSLEMIVGLLGILKAGGAYLPIDPKHPKERIEYMLEDAKLGILATSAKLADTVAFRRTVIDITDEELYSGESGNLELVNTYGDLAYVIYTSGSTGNPKGVMVEHRQVNNFIHAMAKETELTSCGSLLCITTISFDIFGLETLLPLTRGMKVVVASEEEGTDGALLAALIERHGIEAMQSTPSRLKLLLEHAAFRHALGKLDTVLVGGEELPAALGNQLQGYEGLNLYNVYGPTETTIWSAAKRMRGESAGGTIGKPIGNTQVYIVDAYHQLVPIGVPGQLCIAGDGVARGYFHRPELTAEKFVENPFAAGTRMYTTGDLARWLPQGEIEFLGRMDNQVKIRGYRIELGEIEARLTECESVKEAVVVAREDERKQSYLCAYVVGHEGADIDKAKLRQRLKETLPEYMLPSYLVQLERIPLTSNGKVNRKALPVPDESGLVVSGYYEAPRNGIEETLASIWSGVLGVGKIGIHDNFFDLGGHSLKATIVMGEIHKRLQVDVPLRELFRRPTIQELAGYIAGSAVQAYEAIQPCGEQAWYEASSAQKRMYAVQQLDRQSTAYNMPGVFELEGAPDAERIESALKRLVQRHEALRTSFAAVDGDIVQRIDSDAAFAMTFRRRSRTDIHTIAAEFVRPFELERAPLFRAELAESEGKTYLLIDMHHIVSDGVSISILFKEFVRLYNGEALEPLRIQYKDFAAWQNKQLREGAMEKLEAYWVSQFEDGVPVLTLPYDYERPVMQSFEGEALHFALGEEATVRLRSMAKEQEATMPMVLLSAFTILLSKYSGQEDIVVGLPIAGRPHADLQSMVGMFVNTLALRNRPQSGKTYSAFLQEVKQNSLRAYDHQSYPLEQLIEKVNVRRDKSRNPLFDAIFHMNNIDYGTGSEMDGLLFKPVPLDSGLTRADVTLSGYETHNNIELNFTYSTQLFKRQTIERAIVDLMYIIGRICTDPLQTIHELCRLSEEEEAYILQEKAEVHSLRSAEFDF